MSIHDKIGIEGTAVAAAKSLQSCPTLCNPIGQPTRLPCTWDSPGKNTVVGNHSLLQGILLTQESNPVFCIAGRFFTV